jgi:hypothetical protein
MIADSYNLTLSTVLNRPLAAVSLTQGSSSDTVTFVFLDGSAASYKTEGDCCSHSWVEHLEAPNDLVGAVIIDVKEDPILNEDDPDNHDYIQVYHTRFVTNRGEIVLEYRNSSNGYYGGYLVDAV